jgi:hypothetical protein
VVKVYIGKPVGGTYFNTTDGNSDCLIKTDLKLE